MYTWLVLQFNNTIYRALWTDWYPCTETPFLTQNFDSTQVAVQAMNALVGTGILTLPYGLRIAGWVALGMLVGGAFCASYTAKMLVWSCKTINERKIADASRVGKGFVCTYDQVAEEILGRPRNITMKILVFMECLFVGVMFVSLQATNWPVVLHSQGEFHIPGINMQMSAKNIAVIAVCAMSLPTLFVKEEHLSVFAFLGILGTTAVWCSSWASWRRLWTACRHNATQLAWTSVVQSHR